jgi:hypothetical protein
VVSRFAAGWTRGWKPRSISGKCKDKGKDKGKGNGNRNGKQ